MRVRAPVIFLLALSTLVFAAEGIGGGGGRPRGQTSGGYGLTVAGHFSGSGSATISGSSLSISATVKLKSGASGSVTFSNLPVVNGYFSGTGSVLGNSCTISGRVDLPAASDSQQSDNQAITARLVGTIHDTSGNSARIVGIQNEASRGSGGTGGGGGAGGGTGGGTGGGIGGGGESKG